MDLCIELSSRRRHKFFPFGTNLCVLVVAV
nr:MAG TPA: hypothetical protein [Caudoviricetes sp.]